MPFISTFHDFTGKSPAFLRKALRELAGEDPAALEARERYISVWYTGINDFLRGGTNVTDQDRHDAFNLMRLFSDRRVTPRNMMLFRGRGASALPQAGEYDEEDAFLSTSLDLTVARHFAMKATPRDRFRILLHIRTPRGTRYIPGLHSEKELILSPRSKMKHLAVSNSDADGIVHILTELL